MSFQTIGKHEGSRRGNIIMNKYALGNNICKKLKEQNRSQRQMAKDLSISEHSISDYVCGNKNPTVWNLYRISRYLGCTTEDLLEGMDK